MAVQTRDPYRDRSGPKASSRLDHKPKFLAGIDSARYSRKARTVIAPAAATATAAATSRRRLLTFLGASDGTFPAKFTTASSSPSASSIALVPGRSAAARS